MSFFATKRRREQWALKLQRYTVTLCACRFCSKTLVNFFFKNMLKDSENRCVLPLARNSPAALRGG